MLAHSKAYQIPFERHQEKALKESAGPHLIHTSKWLSLEELMLRSLTKQTIESIV